MRIPAIVALVTMLALAGCATKTDEAGADDASGVNTGIQTQQPVNPNAAGSGRVTAATLPSAIASAGDRVFFGFDSAELTPEAQSTLRRQADLLAQVPSAAIRIEGHADERGTREYNFTLGARRATAAKNFLVALGVPSSRIRTISYGKERPEDPRATPEAWARNRRAVTVVDGASGS